MDKKQITLIDIEKLNDEELFELYSDVIKEVDNRNKTEEFDLKAGF